MNYKIIFRDTFQLFRESKLLWIFGAFVMVSDVVYRVSVYSIGKHPASCIPYPLVLVAIYFSLLANCGLIYSVNQIVSKQNPTFSQAWDFCKTKVNRIIGLYFVSVPLVLFALFIPELLRLSEISASLTWVVGVLATFFLTSLFTLSICTIVTYNLGSGLALWTGLLIVFNNFFHIIVLNSIFLILQILLNWSTGNALLGIFLIILLTVTMTLAYRVFITKGSYPALSNIQSTAQ